MDESKVSFTGLLSVAMLLISIGIGLIQQNSNNLLYGVIMIAIGVILIYLAAYLFEKGLIPQLKIPQQKTTDYVPTLTNVCIVSTANYFTLKYSPSMYYGF